MIWRNFFVEKREILSHRKLFRQSNSLATYLVKSLLSRNFCQKCVRENSRNFHNRNSVIQVSQCGKTRNLPKPQKILWNWFFSNFFCKAVVFTKFLQKMWENFRNLNTVRFTVWKRLTRKIFREFVFRCINFRPIMNIPSKFTKSIESFVCK